MKSIVWIGLMVVLVGVVALLSLSSECSATDIVVDVGGDGDYLTIQEGIDNSSDGDTIYVWVGTYTENVELNKSISLVGNGSAVTIIDDGDDSAVINVTSNWCNVTGFNITASNSNGINVSGNYVNISDNQIVSNSGHGIFIDVCHNISIFENIVLANSGHGIISYGVDILISGCNVSSNDYTGIYVMVGSSRVDISFCEAYSNAVGIIIQSGTYDVTISDSYVSANNRGVVVYGVDAVIENCSICSNTLEGVQIHNRGRICNNNISSNSG